MNELIDGFGRSFARAVDGREADFFERFYQRFLAQSQTVADKFSKTDMAHQKAMMRASLLELMQFYTSGKPNEYMKRVAQIHGRAGRDIAREHYLDWLDALLLTVREFDPQYDDQVEMAWRVVLSPGIAYLSHQPTQKG